MFLSITEQVAKINRKEVMEMKMKKKEYHVKAKLELDGTWILYGRTKHLAEAHVLAEVALDLARYNAVQVSEVQSEVLYTKARTKTI